jgi:acyl-coenzyme A thioesterase PaaI-like protein
VASDTEAFDEQRYTARRHAVEALAATIRRLGDVAVETDIDPAEIEAVTRELDGLTERLARRRDTTHYSGLTGLKPDYSTPEGPMPLNPIIGACSPVRPDVSVWTTEDGVRGRAVLSKRFVGPPGFAHGGVSAMLADQLVAVSTHAVRVPCVTKVLHIRFRRPLPLDEPLELAGYCHHDDDGYRATCEIRTGGAVAVEGTAELVTYKELAQRVKQSRRGSEQSGERSP